MMIFYLLSLVRSAPDDPAAPQPTIEIPPVEPEKNITKEPPPPSPDQIIKEKSSQVENDLTISFGVLTGVMVIAIIGLIVFFVVRNKKNAKVTATTDQKESTRSIDSNNVGPGTAKSIYSVNTVVL